ncbi:M20/M25/M40 family metallo-hydrolase [Nocardioides sp. SR21]|uniref:M20/M25/M40 family metallo-hydrolase n=1 Tax=Nocardioides sp. SR21 TaxID=2919501 RepID=UPI001FAA873A|nr:M20/M25/M40 family metallo-hydrolase [Nocardioides sp. SR21]
MSDLHTEVLEVARALIRCDTSNAPGYAGNETLAASYLHEYLTDAGVDCELVARDPHRANLVARIPGSGEAPSLAFVGHLDVVPADPRDWTHPPFAAVVDEGGWLWGRGAIDMKNEVAARAVAMAALAREGFRPRGDLWLIAVADEEDGTADVGMRWLLEARPDIRPDLAINEGGGERLPLADGRVVQTVSIGEKGTFPARVVAVGEAGHASTPDVGANAVPLLAELLRRVGPGMPTPQESPHVDAMLAVLLGGYDDRGEALRDAAALHPVLAHTIPALGGITMAPTLLEGSFKRNVMPARASVELDCRILPGTTEADVERAVRGRLGSDLPYELEWPEELVAGSASSPETGLMDAISRVLVASGDDAELLPMLCTGFTDSVYLRAAGTPTAYGFSPFRSTSAEVLTAGFHNADERVHVDDLLLSVEFHVALAKELLG